MDRTSNRLPTLLVLAACTVLPSACANLPGLKDPAVKLSPRYYIYQVDGRARMQSFGDGGIDDNGAVTMSELGHGTHGDDIGGVIEVGDGFSGLEVEYQRVTLDDSNTGVLTSPFGRLDSGTTVDSSLTQDEYRLTYVAQVLEHEFELDELNSLRTRLGAGLALVHRDGELVVFNDADRNQKDGFGYKDSGMPYLSFRGRVDWRNVSLQVDWDFNPDVTFGGDIEGPLSDVEILGRYEFDAQAITILAGYRWSEVKAAGSTGGLEHALDIELRGYVLGLEFQF